MFVILTAPGPVLAGGQGAQALEALGFACTRLPFEEAGTDRIDNLYARRGITFGPIKVVCKNGDGDPVDLTDWKAWAEARENPGCPVQIDLAPEITDAAAGEITFDHADEVTATWPAGTFRWDLVLENPDGQRLGPFVAGTITVEDVITLPVVEDV